MSGRFLATCSLFNYPSLSALPQLRLKPYFETFWEIKFYRVCALKRSTLLCERMRISPKREVFLVALAKNAVYSQNLPSQNVLITTENLNYSGKTRSLPPLTELLLILT